MKKSILKLGKALEKAEQKEVKGGSEGECACWVGDKLIGAVIFVSCDIGCPDGSRPYIIK